MWFVFRNNTVERFFGKEYRFSGYDDISKVPTDVEGYVWFYQAPVKYDQSILAAEIGGYGQKLGFILTQIECAKSVVALTMEHIYNVPFTDDDHQVRTAIDRYNAQLYALTKQYTNLKVIDLGDFTSRYKASELIDWKYYFISQMGLNPALHKEFKAWFTREMEGIALKRKKCLVLDLDNTLWGGVLGEDGIDSIKIGGDYPGKAFLYFQEALLELSKSGVILTICSKNNEADVMEAWQKNPFNVLKKEHFAAWRINWNNKADNIRELAKELNIGTDSMVFVDDNPTERALIRQELPEVAVPEFPEQPYELPVLFEQIVRDYFKVYSITDEDKKKTEQYKANAQRAQAQASFTNMTSYLRSLDIKIVIEQANEYNIPRIAQMTQKTNQFNLTTHRYTEEEVKGFLADGWKIWCISVADKFGDNGITGCMMVNGSEIDTLLLSCRILGKGIEFAFVKSVLSEIRSQGLTELRAIYLPTAKNGQVAEFYDKCGVKLVSEHDGVKGYVLSLKDADLKVEDYYKIEVK